MKNTIQKFSFVFAFCAAFAMFGASQAMAAPNMQTGSYTATATTATLNGTYNTDGSVMNVWFEYADNSAFFGSIDTPHEAVTGVNLAYSKTITGLTSGKRYYYRILGEGHGQFPTGSTATLVTDVSVSAKPSVMTTGAVNPSPNSINLTCAINTGSDNTADVYFEYGTSTTALTTKTSPQTLTTGATCTTYVTGLNPSTKYYYRAVATNSVGTTTAVTIGQFTTSPTNGGGGGGGSGSNVLPTIYNGAASNITPNSANVSCSYTTGSDSIVSVYFEYGDSSNMPYRTPSQVLGTGGSCMHFASSLFPATRYYYRAVATNSVGTVYAGNILFFDTLPYNGGNGGNGGGNGGNGGGGSNTNHISATTILAKSATTKSIVVSGIVYGNATNARVWFEYGPTTALGQTTAQQYVTINNSYVFSASIAGLKPGTTYYYRAVAMDQSTVSRGDTNYVKTLNTTSTGGSTKVQTGSVKGNSTILDKAADPFGYGNGQGAAALFGFGTGFFPTSLFGWLLLTFMLLLLIVLSRHYFAKKK